MNKKYVYLFEEGNGKKRELLGGKGANLAEMVSLGMPVPGGFTVTTEACTRYYNDNRKIAQEITNEIFENLAKLEKKSGKKFADPANPLLLSVRSGSRASMPGMMDTILNLGLNDEVVEGFAKKTGNARFAYDSYRRFIQMYSDVVMEVGKKYFEELIDKMKEVKGVTEDTELTTQDLKDLAEQFKAEYKSKLGKDFPNDPREQLLGAVEAVFRSWDNPRAVYYRRMNDIPSSWGTAVNIQMMVFGNMGKTSGTGVAFSRNPSTGERKLYGEFLMNAQGEDVVAGTRTPMQIEQLKTIMPHIYDQFAKTSETLEKHYCDMQDMEFTIEEEKLYMLQTRNGKRTAAAAMKIACDLIDEGMKSEQEAVLMIDPKQLDVLLHPQFDADVLKNAEPVGKGLAASPGAACGKVYFTAQDAAQAAVEREEKVILVRLETSPEDIEGMNHAQGILTVRGGMTSHAAVVARGMGTCCVSGCGDVIINEKNKEFSLGGKKYKEGDFISLNGTTGQIYGQAIPTVPVEGITGDFERIMKLADKFRSLKVRTNADTPYDAEQAVKFGAQGIGLTRTEHMFFEADRIGPMREMITASDTAARKKALEKLLPMQIGDFTGIFRAIGDRPVTIRLLDPPLHEFLPQKESDIVALAKEMNISTDELKTKISGLHEFNPMMGHRGCRIAVSYPEIAEMQVRAIIQAAIDVKNETGLDIVPEIMIPLVSAVEEMKFIKNIIKTTADTLLKETGASLKYLIGTMIEIPRAALTADKIAEEAEFFSFGTNDLTQMTFGFSRDDSGSFLECYYNKKIYESDPFSKLDQDGVGQLVKIAVDLGKKARPEIKLGICGEHGGDPSSVEFCHNIGLDYVSCSPFRVPIARLSAAQAAINSGEDKAKVIHG